MSPGPDKRKIVRIGTSESQKKASKQDRRPWPARPLAEATGLPKWGCCQLATLVLNHHHPLHHRQLRHHHHLKAGQGVALVECHCMCSVVQPGLEPVPLGTRRALSPGLRLLVAISYPPLSFCCIVGSGKVPSLKLTSKHFPDFLSEEVATDALLRLHRAGRKVGVRRNEGS